MIRISFQATYEDYQEALQIFTSKNESHVTGLTKAELQVVACMTARPEWEPGRFSRSYLEGHRLPYPGGLMPSHQKPHTSLGRKQVAVKKSIGLALELILGSLAT